MRTRNRLSSFFFLFTLLVTLLPLFTKHWKRDEIFNNFGISCHRTFVFSMNKRLGDIWIKIEFTHGKHSIWMENAGWTYTLLFQSFILSQRNRDERFYRYRPTGSASGVFYSWIKKEKEKKACSQPHRLLHWSGSATGVTPTTMLVT